MGGAAALMDPDLGGGWGGVQPNLLAAALASMALEEALVPDWLS